MGNREDGKNKQRPIDLLRAANSSKIKNIRIDLPGCEAFMSIPDIFLISKERRKVEKIAYAEYRREGLHQEPIIEEDWDKYFKDSLETQRKNAAKLGKKFNEKEVFAAILKEKPDSLAKQLATEDANLEMIIGILPKMIKMSDGKTPMFPTLDEQKEFQELVRSDPKMFEYLAQKVTEAFTLWSDIKDEVKNSSPAESSENGEFKNSAPEDTPDTEDHSTQN